MTGSARIFDPRPVNNREDDPVIRLFLSACAAAVFIACAPADAQRRGGDAPVIELYDGPNYSGPSIRLDGEAPDLSRIGFNDRASSIRIVSGQWEVCVDAHFRGSCEVVTASRPDIRRWAFNNRISAVRPVRFRGRGADRGITLYYGRDFTGRSVTLIEPVSDFRRISFNDQARSIQVHSGRWVLCQDNDFEDNCREFTRDVSDLRRFGLDRAVSSAAPAADYQAHERRRRQPVGRHPDYGDDFSRNPQFGRRERIGPGARGLSATFYARPEVNGYAVADCTSGSGRGCGDRAADAFCRAAGHGRSAYSARTRRGGQAWFLDERRIAFSNAALIDVLCVN